MHNKQRPAASLKKPAAVRGEEFGKIYVPCWAVVRLTAVKRTRFGAPAAPIGNQIRYFFWRC